METKIGLFLVVTDDTELISTLVRIQPRGMEVKVWCPAKPCQLQSELINACQVNENEECLTKGDVTKAQFYQDYLNYDPICVVLALKEASKHNAVRTMILATLPDAKILSITLGNLNSPTRVLDSERELVLSWTELLTRPVRAELRHIQATHQVKAVRDVLDPGDKIALLLQPDPDPDSLASALALRTLLGRNKVSTPIVSFGRVTRPENIAMMRLLDLEVLTIKPEDLINYDRVAMLDTQPSHFNFPLPKIDAIIDHHPVTTNYIIPYKDIRPFYGATSTILTEYLKASATPIGQRLSTALIYGIKSDTLFLNRPVIDADLDAFVSLYPNINYNLLRRIEKPELPMRFAPVLANALKSMEHEKGVLVTCLGQVEREDLIPQVADFLLQFEDVEWVVCSGLFEDNVVMSIRNVGYVKNAGDVVKRVIGDWGNGGGHRTMAKAIFPAAEWKKHFGSLTSASIKEQVLKLFLQEIL